MTDTPNAIDKAFKVYLSNNPTPSNDKQWMFYLDKMFMFAFSEGADYAIESMTKEFEKATEEKE